MKFEKGSTGKARKLATGWIDEQFSEDRSILTCGLPEYDDRLDSWRVSVQIKGSSGEPVAELRIDSALTRVIEATKTEIVKKRILQTEQENQQIFATKKKSIFYPTPIPNSIVLGDCVRVLEEYPPDTAQLIVTSPPYYNAKPEYSEYVDYQEYLDFLRRVIVRCHAILSEGRFFIINVSPVLIKRTSRSTSSKRIPIPFDLHRIFDSVGFDFIDDIIWEKPEGAGWNVGRGRRFRADRQPLQYKPVTVTEYILVYRKRTDKLIDWNIRNHHSREDVENSRILGDYDVSNIWRIPPSTNRAHPATFPDELVRRAIRYYSFQNDLVLDPFAGSGTVGRVALEMDRRFLLIDQEPAYYQLMQESILSLAPANLRINSYIADDPPEQEDAE